MPYFNYKNDFDLILFAEVHWKNIRTPWKKEKKFSSPKNIYFNFLLKKIGKNREK